MTTDAKRLQDQMQAGKFADELDLIQYRTKGGTNVSTVLCARHRGDLLRNLKTMGIGCIGCRAGSLSRCDMCESTRSGFTDRRESDFPCCDGSEDADAGERLTEPLSGIPIPLDHDRTEFRTLAPESTPGDSAGAESVVGQAAQVLRESPAASPGGKAWALADAGLLARARVADLEAEVERLRRNRDFVRTQRDNAWEECDELPTLRLRARAAESRARRAEDALRRMTATARCVLGDNRIESDADIGDYIDPNLGELWLDVKRADRALTSETGEETTND